MPDPAPLRATVAACAAWMPVANTSNARSDSPASRASRLCVVIFIASPPTHVLQSRQPQRPKPAGKPAGVPTRSTLLPPNGVVNPVAGGLTFRLVRPASQQGVDESYELYHADDRARDDRDRSVEQDVQAAAVVAAADRGGGLEGGVAARAGECSMNPSRKARCMTQTRSGCADDTSLKTQLRTSSARSTAPTSPRAACRPLRRPRRSPRPARRGRRDGTRDARRRTPERASAPDVATHGGDARRGRRSRRAP